MADDKKTYTGSCHCGAVKFSFEHKPLEDTEVMCCNCSICQRNGYLLIYPAQPDFTLLSGEDSLKSYEFNKKAITHKFCSECGTSVFADGKSHGIVAVNVRAIPDLDVQGLKLKYYDGRNLV